MPDEAIPRKEAGQAVTDLDKGKSEWTLNTLRVHMDSRVDDLRRLLDERYQTQVAATEKAFAAQQLAMQTALAAQERAVAAAMTASEMASAKAERSAEARFAAVNEFRAQLADQAATLMGRLEARALIDAQAEKINTIAARLDKSEGRGAGLHAGWVYLLAGIAAIGTIISIFIAFNPV
jgi:hypothetical protein